MLKTLRRFGQTRWAAAISAALWFAFVLAGCIGIILDADLATERSSAMQVVDVGNYQGAWLRTNMIGIGYAMMAAFMIFGALLAPRGIGLRGAIALFLLALATSVIGSIWLFPKSWTDQSVERLIQTSLSLAEAAIGLGVILGLLALGYFFVFKPLLKLEARAKERADSKLSGRGSDETSRR